MIDHVTDNYNYDKLCKLKFQATYYVSRKPAYSVQSLLANEPCHVYGVVQVLPHGISQQPTTPWGNPYYSASTVQHSNIRYVLRIV